MYPTTEIKRAICRAFAAECERNGSNSYDVLSNEGLPGPDYERLHEIHERAEQAALAAANGNRTHVVYALTDDGHPVLGVD
jgi:hypothetical protein